MHDQLRAAIKGEDVNEVKTLISAGADINHLDTYKISPLLGSVYSNKIEYAKILLEAKADVNGAGGHPPICTATNFRKLDFAKLLIQHAADVNITFLDRSFTALHLSASNGDLDFIKLLLDAGAHTNLEFKSDMRWTPLYSAIYVGHSLPAASLLLDYGAKTQNVELGRTKPPWMDALFETRRNIKRTLLVFYHLGRKNPYLKKDMTDKIAKMIWETRDSPSWLTHEESSPKKMKI